MTDPRRPLHLGVFLGLSAGAYATGLAAVTWLQVQSEAAVLEGRAPAAQTIDALAAQNNSLASSEQRAGASYRRATDAYDLVAKTLADVEAQLADLGGVVGAVDGAAGALPDRVALPRIDRAPAVMSRGPVAVSQPTVHATTAASGG